MVISVTQVVGGVLAGVLLTVLVLGPLVMHYRKEAQELAVQRDRLLTRIQSREAYRNVFDELGRLREGPTRAARREGVPPRGER